MDEASLRLAQRSVGLVRGPAAKDQGARVLDLGLQPALLHLAVRILQPSVLPHCHHAEHSQVNFEIVFFYTKYPSAAIEQSTWAIEMKTF